MVIQAVCLTKSNLSRYRRISSAMSQGIRAVGDHPVVCEVGNKRYGSVGVIYGWKHHAEVEKFPRFVYADLGYWKRDRYYRLCCNAWSPEKYVRAGLDSSRFDELGLEIKPWHDGEEIIIAGSSAKAAKDHGLGYMEWEKAAALKLQDCGYRVMFRPKPGDPQAFPIPGTELDRRPLEQALASARALVTHHSNTAIDALLAGVPVHCETGAAAAFSVPMEEIAKAPRMSGREQFLYDVAWLQWTETEMKLGYAWKHLKERSLLC